VVWDAMSQKPSSVSRCLAGARRWRVPIDSSITSTSHSIRSWNLTVMPRSSESPSNRWSDPQDRRNLTSLAARGHGRLRTVNESCDVGFTTMVNMAMTPEHLVLGVVKAKIGSGSRRVRKGCRPEAR